MTHLLPLRPTMLLAAMLLLATSVPLRAESEDSPDFERHVQPLLAKYCYECHGPQRQRADLNLALFKTTPNAVAAPDVWQQALARINAGEMPPDADRQLSEQERQLLQTWFDKLPAEEKTDCNQLATDETQRWYRGYVMSRRLNRAEYNNSVRDLIGLDLKPGDSFPADGSGGEGFDNHGDALFTSPILMEKYLEAADLLLEAVLLDDASPLLPEAAAAREKLLVAVPGDQWSPREAAWQVVARFARRAFRRPVTDEELERLMTLFDHARQRGDSYEASVRLALKAVLMSPHFLFLVETEPEQEGVYRLNHYQIAARLAYFIWASIPDDELLALADEEKLYDKYVLRRQVRRMLQDPKAQALGEQFAMQWLGMDPLGETIKPDPERFPEFDDELAAAMRGELVTMFYDLFHNDRSLLELIDGDSTFVNERLARHYGIGGVSGPEMRRVSLGDPHRGGVVGMAAVHTVTSHPLRTSPVLRGKWVLEHLLGSKIPPPPDDAGSLPPEVDTSSLSLRQQLEAHRTKAECAACHNRMDPLGFGLENFDAIGRWRTEDGGQPLDTTGQLPSGESFETPAELKQVLMKRQDEIVRNLARKMLGYALGRELNKFDDCVIDETIKALKANDHRASVLVEQIVLSYPFQHRFAKK